MSRNPNITPDIIQQNLEKDWNQRYLSMNENITWDIIESNLDKPWDWDHLSENSMSKFKKIWINQRRLQHIKAY